MMGGLASSYLGKANVLEELAHPESRMLALHRQLHGADAPFPVSLYDRDPLTYAAELRRVAAGLLDEALEMSPDSAELIAIQARVSSASARL